MKSRFLFTLFIVIMNSNSHAQLIFKNGFEFVPRLNDTGITFAAENPGNNAECTSTTVTSPQDCNSGRDASPLTNSDADGHAGFSFTKLDDNGTPLTDQTVDYATTPWACVQDNVTGLVWEVKTTAAGIHNKDNIYQWGGLTAIGRDHPNSQGAYYDPSWNDLVQGSNTDTFCGYNNWRVPTVAELTSIVNKGSNNPAIDTNYFPSTEPTGFWSSSPVAGNNNNAWIVLFDYGVNDDVSRDIEYRARLVRSGL